MSTPLPSSTAAADGLDPRSRLRGAPDVRSCELEGELVLLDLHAGEYYGLGPLGTLVWGKLSEGKTVGEIGELVAREYEVTSAAALEDIAAFVRELVEAGLVVVDAASEVAEAGQSAHGAASTDATAPEPRS